MESSGSEEVGPEEGVDKGLIIGLIVNFIVLPGLLCLCCYCNGQCQPNQVNSEMIERQDQVIKPFE